MNTFREIVQNPEFQHKVATEIRRYRAGDAIIEEGDQGTEVFLVLEGKAEVYATVEQPGDHEHRTGLARLAADEVIGELALFDHEPRTASVIAVTDCEVAVMDGQILASYMDQHPEQGYWILKNIFSQVVRRMRQATLRGNTITALYLQDYADY